MSSFSTDSSGMPALYYEVAWDQWTSQFAPTLSGFGWLRYFVDLGYADLPALPDDASASDIAIWKERNETRAFLREKVEFAWPGRTDLYILSPGACRVLYANPPPSVPTFDWVRSASQTDQWAADLARGRVDRHSCELLSATQVFLFLPGASAPSPPCLCPPFGARLVDW
jgi:hypothetical protein